MVEPVPVAVSEAVNDGDSLSVAAKAAPESSAVESYDEIASRLDAERQAILKELAEMGEDTEKYAIPSSTPSAPPASAPAPAASPTTSLAPPPQTPQLPLVPASGALPPPLPSPPAPLPSPTAARPAKDQGSTQPRAGSARPSRKPTVAKVLPTEDPDPLVRLNEILLDCEKEVRDTKGFIQNPGDAVVKIQRVRKGQDAPKNATFLSRPKDTGVDFRVPVEVPGYRDFVENPITLNQIKERCRTRKYTRFEGYLNDMRLLAKNTADFNVDPQVQWVVQHGNLLLEAAIDAVEARKKALIVAESELSAKEGSMAAIIRGASSAGNSKANHQAQPQPNGGAARRGRRDGPSAKQLPSPALGTEIMVFWNPDRKWHSSKVMKYLGNDFMEVAFFADGTTERVRIDSTNWKPVKRTQMTKQAPREPPSSTPHPGSKKRKLSEEDSEKPVAEAVTLFDLESIRSEMLNKVAQIRMDLVREVQSLFGRLEGAVDSPQRSLEAVVPAVKSMEVLIREMRAGHAREVRSLKEDFKNHLQ